MRSESPVTVLIRVPVMIRVPVLAAAVHLALSRSRSVALSLSSMALSSMALPALVLSVAILSAGCENQGLADPDLEPPPVAEEAGIEEASVGDGPFGDGTFDVVETTIREIRRAVVGGRVSCRQVVRAHLDRIEQYDRRPDAIGRVLGAITEVHPRALERADALDRKLERLRAQGGEPGPLFCAPILVKDNFDTHDLPTTGGSIALLDSVPPDDAFLVRRLREADAVILAKTNMAEWAFSPRQTISSSYGTTANAYALDRVPAGSSGGTASGVAASFAVAGLGSDTGNSIRGPSSHLALFGIRSTLGLVSRDGVIPLVADRDVAGPMARTVEDGTRLFDVLAGHDPADPLSEEGRREADYTARLVKHGLRGARLGVLRAHADPASTDPEILALFEQALEDLREAGAELVDPVEIPSWEVHAGANYFCPTFRHDLARYLETLGESAPFDDLSTVFEADQYSPHARSGIEFFLNFPADLGQDEWPEPCPTFLRHPGRRAFLDDVVSAMDGRGEENRIDALVFPTWSQPAAALDRGHEDYAGDNSQLVAPSTGMPAATVPMGWLSDGLPTGLQILARRWDDGLVIQYAYAYEQATLHRRAPAGFPALARE